LVVSDRLDLPGAVPQGHSSVREVRMSGLIRKAVEGAFAAATRRAETLGYFPVTPAAVAGLLLTHAGNTDEARDYVERVLQIFDAIDQEDTGMSLGAPSLVTMPLAKVRLAGGSER